MNWNDYKAEFAWDGSWRDVCVLDTDIDDWQQFIVFLKSSVYPLQFSINGDPTTLPDNVRQVFEDRRDKAPLLSVTVSNVTLHCHFFGDDEIELDFDPRAIKAAAQAEALFTFMKRVGKALGKAVRITPENMHEAAIFEVNPVDQLFHYYPCRESAT